ncbi:hypothetical protein CRYUN_Cryun40dG0031300 [Craigia yunnanensis]
MSPFFGEKPPEQKPPIRQHIPPHRRLLEEDVEGTLEPPKIPGDKPPKGKGGKPPYEHKPTRFVIDEQYMSPFCGEKSPEQKPPIQHPKPPNRRLLGKDVEDSYKPPKLPSVMKPPTAKGKKPPLEHNPPLEHHP